MGALYAQHEAPATTTNQKGGNIDRRNVAHYTVEMAKPPNEPEEEREASASEAPEKEAPSEAPRASEPPREGEEGQEAHARRRRLEGVLREVIKRGLEAGLDTWSRTDKALRGVAGDVKLPREFVHYVFSQIDETKSGLLRVVSKEVREFLEATDLSTELQKVLTALSFEIKTEIRFIPNDSGTGIRPSVKAKAAPRKQKKSEPPETEPTQEPDQET